jgi:16S rRNA U1498 N3-methylase RsmE
MRRFFVECDAMPGDRVTISGKDARHIVKALRLKPGDDNRDAYIRRYVIYGHIIQETRFALAQHHIRNYNEVGRVASRGLFMQ